MSAAIPLVACVGSIALSAIADDALILVRAQVVKTLPAVSDDTIESDLVIQHVYRGPSGLVGSKFLDSSSTGQDTTGVSANPPLRVGQTGLWSLARRGEMLVVKRFHDLPFSYRARSGVTPRYAELERLAEAIENFDHTEPSGKVDRLIALAMDQAPEISAWAVRTLDALSNESATAALNRLAEDKRLCAPSRVALDTALARLRGAAWLHSDARRALLLGAATSASSYEEANALLNHIENSTIQDELRTNELLSLAEAVARNRALPSQAKVEAYFAVARMASRGDDTASAFSALVEHVKTDSEPASRRGAARALGLFPSLSDDQRVLLRELAKNESDKETATILIHVSDRKG